jgi:hypothetical protein
MDEKNNNFLISPLQAQAKLFFLSPKEMITSSDHIIIGTIINRIYSGLQRKVTISIETFLKGEMNKEDVIVEGDKNPIYGWLDFKFPKNGTKMMVFLKKEHHEHGYYLPGDGFSVVVIKNDGKDIELFNGVNKGSQGYKLREEAYLTFLKAYYKYK